MKRHYFHLLAVKDGFVTGVTATRVWSTGAIPGCLVWCGKVYGLVWYCMVTTTISCMVWYGMVLYSNVRYDVVTATSPSAPNSLSELKIKWHCHWLTGEGSCKPFILMSFYLKYAMVGYG